MGLRQEERGPEISPKTILAGFAFAKAGAELSITPASNDELCLSAAGTTKTVSVQPCKEADCAKEPRNHCVVGEEYNNWRYDQALSSLSILLNKGDDPYCLAAPPKDQQWPVLSLEHCNNSDALQRWTIGKQDGSICSAAEAADDTVSRCVTWSGGFEPSLARLYPAVRDAKAAVRWIR